MNKPDLTVARLRELLHYNPQTGMFTRLKPRGPAKAGDQCTALNDSGYVLICCDYRHYRAHRLAWLYTHGVLPSSEIDHINGVRSDNRLANLRLATKNLNMQNIHKPKINNKSGFLGVWKQTLADSYQASIMVNGKSKYLGTFPTAEAASIAYAEAKSILHKDACMSGHKHLKSRGF